MQMYLYERQSSRVRHGCVQVLRRSSGADAQRARGAQKAGESVTSPKKFRVWVKPTLRWAFAALAAGIVAWTMLAHGAKRRMPGKLQILDKWHHSNEQLTGTQQYHLARAQSDSLGALTSSESASAYIAPKGCERTSLHNDVSFCFWTLMHRGTFSVI